MRSARPPGWVPGYFPRILGILLLVLGALITFRGIRCGRRRDSRVEVAPDLVVLGSRRDLRHPRQQARRGDLDRPTDHRRVSAASHEFRFKESIIAGVLLSALAVGVFVVGLERAAADLARVR